MIYFALFVAAVFGGNSISSAAAPAVVCPDYSSELICENCKCFGATKFNYKKNGDNAIITRSDCAAAAHAAQATYYSWLRNGAELFCSFDTHKDHAHLKFTVMIGSPTEEEVCGNAGMDTATTKPWKIFKLNSNTENCNCQIVRATIEQPGKKCGGFEKLENLRHGRTPATAADANACAKLAFQAGYTLFSYRTDKLWCMYGHYYSDDEACTRAPPSLGAMGWVETKAPWNIYLAECAENYLTYTLDQCTPPDAVAYPKAMASAHVVCCPANSDPSHFMSDPPTATCSRVNLQTGLCFSDSPKSYTEAQAICQAAGMTTCQGPTELTTCCGSGCAGNSAAWWTATMASVTAASTGQ